VNASFSQKIDSFCHILPPKYKQALDKKASHCFYLEANRLRPALFDLDIRFRVMDKYEGLRQVLTLGVPPLEYVVSADEAVDLSKMANDEMAELVTKYPDRFVAAAACLPMNNIDAALKEAERAISELNLRGIQIYSSINGKPLDTPEFMALYEKMAEYDLPIWIHPARDQKIADYPGEEASKYNLFLVFGWPYETTLCMARLVFSGVLERYPNIKFIAHHCGAMIPFFAQRIPTGPTGKTNPDEKDVLRLSKSPLAYFQKFYADTVPTGGTPALMCAYEFFGPDNLVFGSDYPYPGGAQGEGFALGEAIRSVESMDVPPAVKAKIFGKNTERILRLSR
jgi:aminocarboxymuconate-semialdehyde decarboxylase